MDDQHEEFEHIPWGELLASTDDGRRRALYLVAGAVGALVLGGVMTRALSSPAAPQPAPAPVAVATTPIATAPMPTTPAVALPVPPPVTTTTTTLAAPVLYAEADLMAFPPDLGARAAVARAEWFVTDYFTADLEPNGTADLRGALPAGV